MSNATLGTCISHLLRKHAEAGDSAANPSLWCVLHNAVALPRPPSNIGTARSSKVSAGVQQVTIGIVLACLR